MSFVKAYAHMGIWKDYSITQEQEEEVKESSRREHNEQMLQCINDAKEVIRKAFPGGDVSQVLPTTIAAALFKVRASHTQFYRERLARKVFEEMVSK